MRSIQQSNQKSCCLSSSIENISPVKKDYSCTNESNLYTVNNYTDYYSFKKTAKLVKQIIDQLINDKKNNSNNNYNHDNSSNNKNSFYKLFDCNLFYNTSFTKYITNILRTFKVQKHIVLGSLILIDKFCNNNPEFAVTKVNRCLLFLASLIISMKVQDDIVYDDKSYSLGSGVELAWLVLIESGFLYGINYNSFINHEAFFEYSYSFDLLYNDSKNC